MGPDGTPCLHVGWQDWPEPNVFVQVPLPINAASKFSVQSCFASQFLECNMWLDLKSKHASDVNPASVILGSVVGAAFT
jgi:hypothetical protein